MIRNGILLAAWLALGFTAVAWGADGPPVAAVKPVVDDYFGTKVTDDYRWMEDRKAPEFVAWAKAENAYARQVLDRVPGRDKLLARIVAHTSGGASVGSVRLGGARVFYLKRKPGENAFRLYVRDRVDGPERLLVDPEAIPTTGPHYAIDYFEPSQEGAVSGPVVSPTSSTVLVGLQGWVRAPAIYSLGEGAPIRTDIVPPWADDLSPFESAEVMATAKDGAKIPLSIVYRKGLKRDGSHPIWLTGYGAYGIALTPSLVSRFLPFLEDGGVYAVAHVRGGGEFGEDWHLAGKIATKPNTWNDLIACAEYLVAERYGKPEALAIEGRSAGGITVGRALTERPDLFRVVFDGVGDGNTLRSENGTDGPANALEYGSVKTEAGFKALLASDSTQHVKPGVAYPAVLLTTGMNDPRVAPWQPGKMAAHLQAANPTGRPVLMVVDFDAGHGMGSTKAQRDKEMADQMAFFYWQIGKPDDQPPTK